MGQKKKEADYKKELKEIPDNLKTGIENLSGIKMDDAIIQYNSLNPEQLNAHAYAQGTNIHLSPGQEKYLPHEAWQVVQQKQGRVKPSILRLSKIYLENQLGIIDSDVPFQPFGPLPVKGSSFVFGSSEWLGKSISEVTIKLFWNGLPTDFAEYYKPYDSDFKNSSFKVNFFFLQDGSWKSLDSKPIKLFEENKEDGTISEISTLTLKFNENLFFPKPIENDEVFSFTRNNDSGFIKMTLVSPEDAFGHSIYLELFPSTVLKNARAESAFRIPFFKKKKIPIPLPPPPYTPVAEKIIISFTI